MDTSPADRIACDAATPPRRPTAMPRQEIAFWTPRRVVAAALRAAGGALRHAPHPGAAGSGTR
jgi:hypothetical protein